MKDVELDMLLPALASTCGEVCDQAEQLWARRVDEARILLSNAEFC